MQVHAPTNARTEKEIDKFQGDITAAKLQCKEEEVILIMEDLNAKVGEGSFEGIVGQCGLRNGNDRGTR